MNIPELIWLVYSSDSVVFIHTTMYYANQPLCGEKKNISQIFKLWNTVYWDIKSHARPSQILRIVQMKHLATKIPLTYLGLLSAGPKSLMPVYWFDIVFIPYENECALAYMRWKEHRIRTFSLASRVSRCVSIVCVTRAYTFTQNRHYKIHRIMPERRSALEKTLSERWRTIE